MPGLTKIRADWEHRYVADFVLHKFPDEMVKLRCPLGTVPELWVQELGFGKALKSYRPYRPEVDAIVITGEKLILIEAKIMKVLDGMSKLPIYRLLVPETPELKDFAEMPTEMWLVTPKKPGWEERVAKELNIHVEIFMPDWIKEYYEQQEKYWTAEERLKRLKRKEVLKSLGYY